MQSTKEDSTGFQQVHRNKAKPKNTPVFEETMDHEPRPPPPQNQPLTNGLIYLTFTLVTRRFINLDMKNKIINTFYKYIGERCKIKSNNLEVSFGVKPHQLNKAKEFVNQSNGLDHLKIKTNEQNKPNVNSKKTKQASKEPAKSKGIVDTNGASEKQFKETFNFNANRITDFQPIKNKWGKLSGKAILTFDMCEPPLEVHSEEHVKEIKPLLFNPTRCNVCQNHGHHTARCKSNTVRCTYCCGAHRSKDCQVDFRFYPYLCFNCVKEKRTDTNHSANHPGCKSWVDYKARINVKNQSIMQQWEQRKAGTKLKWNSPPPSSSPSTLPAPTNLSNLTISAPATTPAPSYAQALSHSHKPSEPELPHSVKTLDVTAKGNNMMQVKGLAAILKFLLRSDNLSAIQNMDASKRDDYIERLVSAPHLFNETANTSGTCPPDIVDLTDMAPE